MIDTRLMTFLTLLEEKNYTKTANKLYITQPAVTHHIKSLEKDNNITIFRDNKTFELTHAGSLLKEYAELARSQYMQFNNALSKKVNMVVANMAITPMASSALNKDFIKELISSKDGNLNIYEYNYDKIVENLLLGKLDFAIIDNSFDSSVFDSFTLALTPLVLICNPNGKYKENSRISREQLSSAVVVIAEEGTGLHRCTINGLNQKNIKLKNNIVVSSNSVDWMIRQVLITDGIGFVYEDSVKEYLNKGIVRKIELLNFHFSQNIYLMYNRKSFLNNSILNLIENIKKYDGNK